jgi:hypothetical protein
MKDQLIFTRQQKRIIRDLHFYFVDLIERRDRTLMEYYPDPDEFKVGLELLKTHRWERTPTTYHPDDIPILNKLYRTYIEMPK